MNENLGCKTDAKCGEMPFSLRQCVFSRVRVGAYFIPLNRVSNTHDFETNKER